MTDGSEPPIVVVGVRPKTPPPPPPGPPRPPYQPTPPQPPAPPPVGGPGAPGDPPSSRKIADYTRVCSTPSGLAADLAKKIVGWSASGPPNPILTPEGSDWTRVEMGALVHGSEGEFKAFNAAIYSNNVASRTWLPNPPTDFIGIIHNHIPRGGSDQQNIDKYPSDRFTGGADWESLQLYSVRSGNPDPSLWILGPDSKLREFKLSERQKFQGLTLEQLRAGVGLEGTERTDAC